jgi:hypothetical protein
MPNIERTCKVTGQKFLVSEQEQELRKKFGVELPDIAPNERLRLLTANRNLYVLFNDECDLCKKKILSIWGENPVHPVYCRECWFSDKWEAPQQDLNLERPFFEQFKELLDKSPRVARLVQEPAENSDYCNNAGAIKNCYMSFNFDHAEECYYVLGGNQLKNCVDCSVTNEAEFLYDCVACNKSYQTFSSEFAVNCSDCYFLYDCSDCNNCALSTGLRHKEYVFMNEQLSKEEYEKKIADVKSGSYEKFQKNLSDYRKLKATYPKKSMIGLNNENVSGNFVFQSKNVDNSYYINYAEDVANCYTIHHIKDALDMTGFGDESEKIYFSSTCGGGSSELMFCIACFPSCSSVTYSIGLVSSSNCFGSSFAKNLEYSILNKKYTEEEYKMLVAKLKEKMTERGEWGQFFNNDITLFPYNVSLANVLMPLPKEEALKRGFRWVERKFPQVSQEQIYNAADNIADVKWEELEHKYIICSETKRPFKIIKQEFDFYKKYNLPLPRLHPEIRMVGRYPKDLLFNLHEATCSNCNKKVMTSMLETDILLCEDCYREKVA